MASLVLTDSSLLTSNSQHLGIYSSPVASLVLTDSSLLTSNSQHVGIYSSPVASLVMTDSSLLTSNSQHLDLMTVCVIFLRLPVTRPARALRSRTCSSASDSPHSLDSKTRSLGSPLRPPRQVQASECEDGSIRLDRGTYQYMFQDIVSIKTMLLKLKRVLQEWKIILEKPPYRDSNLNLPVIGSIIYCESSALDHTAAKAGVFKDAETLNPFDSSLKNGLFYSLASSEDGGDCEGQLVGGSGGTGEEVTDLRRQTVLLQQQLEEKERTIQLLQVQMTKYTTSTATSSSVPETCNAATQTERVRPVSAGPSLLQSLPSESNMGPLVSSSDVCTRRQSETPLSRLPMVTKNWRRTSLTASSAPPSVEQSNIPTRKLNSLSLLRKVPATGNGLPPKS
uniref:Uncharacterized protein n=1 Tax=Timema shepardi TaxID=629360 RepID=A0A7R9B1P9_TIMSH|nr:unnamed protein product [Timema shepardi]